MGWNRDERNSATGLAASGSIPVAGFNEVTAEYCLGFLRRIRDCSFATIDSEGLPSVRVIDVMHVKDNRLYFLVPRGKAFYKEIEDNPVVAVLGQTTDYRTCRLRGRVVRGRDAEQKRLVDLMFELNPDMKDLYPGESRYASDVFFVEDATGDYFDLGQKPVVRERFTLGKGFTSMGASYRVTDSCIGCQACVDVCPQSCIALSEKSACVIQQSTCLHCGLCFETVHTMQSERKSMNDRDNLAYCVEYLALEKLDQSSAKALVNSAKGDPDQLFSAYRNFVNVREPKPASPEFLRAQDCMLQDLIRHAGVTDLSALSPSSYDDRICLWRGDIVTLGVDAIVNAANAQMLGCWVPGHHCIDNAIHTFAGIQLRAECSRIMAEQGHPEPAGKAKVTAAYNLPCKWVIHTVGPVSGPNPGDDECALLASCYQSSLDAAHGEGAKSIAFCCISTGVFGFPQLPAAQIALETVKEWLDRNDSSLTVVFNVFSDSDERIYRELLRG